MRKTHKTLFNPKLFKNPKFFDLGKLLLKIPGTTIAKFSGGYNNPSPSSSNIVVENCSPPPPPPPVPNEASDKVVSVFVSARVMVDRGGDGDGGAYARSLPFKEGGRVGRGGASIVRVEVEGVGEVDRSFSFTRVRVFDGSIVKSLPRSLGRGGDGSCEKVSKEGDLEGFGERLRGE
jgi:hypothetical protein